MLESLAACKQHLATWNVRGNLNGLTGKLDLVLRWASNTKIGVLAVQEASTAYIFDADIVDCYGGSWHVCLTPPMHGGKTMGQGFLVSSEYEIIAFELKSAWICRVVLKARHSNQKFAIINAHAPTELKTTDEELSSFYTAVTEVLVEERKEHGHQHVAVLGDFNGSITTAQIDLHLGINILGGCLKPGERNY